MRDSDYKPLSAYAAIGSLTTAALVGSDGSIDWCCLPELDSPSVFAAILDARKGGRWRIGPASGASGTQRYLDRTNVVETTFVQPTGTAGVIDFMPYWEGIAHGRDQAIVRIVEGQRGEIELEQEFAPRFDYARARHQARLEGDRVVRFTSQGPDGLCLILRCEVPCQLQDGDAVAEFTLREGQSSWFVLECARPAGESPSICMDTARAPKINIGIASGSTSSDSSTLPRRTPTVSAAPIPPSTLSVPVPSSRDSISTPQTAIGSPRPVPTMGDMMTSGRPVSTQCAATLASNTQPSGCPDSTHCSIVPSSTSARNSDSSASNDDSSVATHNTPVPTSRSCAVVGDKASGNNVTTMMKKMSG